MKLSFLRYWLALPVIVLAGTSIASAHVVVKPAEVGVGTFQTFTIGVPNEKDMATVGVRLVIPEGLNYVSPSVKPGWTIATKKEGEGDEAKVMEINWTGGSIPAEQRDDFTFSAQVPTAASSLNWKAYQTYSDGTIVSWDQEPSKEHKEGSTPYSVTTVVNDLTATSKSESTTNDLPFYISIAALVVAGASLMLHRR